MKPFYLVENGSLEISSDMTTMLMTVPFSDLIGGGEDEEPQGTDTTIYPLLLASYGEGMTTPLFTGTSDAVALFNDLRLDNWPVDLNVKSVGEVTKDGTVEIKITWKPPSADAVVDIYTVSHN